MVHKDECIRVLTHFGKINRNQRMLPRFNEKSEIRHKWNIVVTVKINLTQHKIK